MYISVHPIQSVLQQINEQTLGKTYSKMMFGWTSIVHYTGHSSLNSYSKTVQRSGDA